MAPRKAASRSPSPNYQRKLGGSASRSPSAINQDDEPYFFTRPFWDFFDYLCELREFICIAPWCCSAGASRVSPDMTRSR